MTIKVGVLRGGPSNEHEISLKTGENILKFLPEEKYQGVDIILGKDGNIFADDFPIKFQQLHYLVDIVFNSLHGYFGEDGKVQRLLDGAQIPYTGSGPLASALGMNKVLSRDIFQKAGLKIPRAFVVKEGESVENKAMEVFQDFNPPWVIKPVSGGSSIGISIADSFGELKSAIEIAFGHDSSVLVEEYIKGREATCGILEDFRGEEYYALPPIEIVVSGGHKFFDYEAKYNDDSTKEICPANFDLGVKKELENMARLAHKIIGCRGYSRSDMIISPRGIYILEINTLPGQTIASLIPKAAEAVGLSFPDLLGHVLKTTLDKISE